ncbi:MAG TPA: SMC-Scp complex subunit ScpB [Steroidobacteraceae bacterium]|jgi:segregation and condensation protein B
MSPEEIRNVIEAALLAAGKSVPISDLSGLFDESERPDTAGIRAALEALAAHYEGRAIELKETGGGWRVQVRRSYAPTVARLWPERPPRYSRALLETLALIAYRQPITRAEIEAVRGVTVNSDITKTLLERQWIRVVGHRDLPGRPELLGTTREFLEYFGLRSLDQLPPLTELSSLGELDPQLDLSVAGAPVAGLTSSAAADETGDDEAADAAAADADEYSADAAAHPGLVAAPPEDPR